MENSRRNFFGVALGVCFAASTVAHAAEPLIIPTKDEAKTIAYMKENGVDHFMMLNKRRGQILFVIGNKITETAPALSGLLKGDAHKKDLKVTPAGIFKLDSFDDNNSIGFKWIEGTNLVYAIHTVLEVKGQKRPERLNSLRPEWQRISAGCVNVSQDTIYKIQGLMTIPQEFRSGEVSPTIRGSFFVILPEAAPVASILKPPEYKRF